MTVGLIQGLATLMPTVAVLLILAALALLWRAHRSIWLIVAMVAELFGLGFRIVSMIAPDLMRQVSLIPTLWLATGVVFGIGLLAYALEVTRK